MSSNYLNKYLFVIIFCIVSISRTMATDASVTTFTKNGEQVVERCTADVTLSTSVDYVLTATSQALTGSIDICHPSAAVVFRNIKPTTALNDYLSKIKINGAAAENGTNCRFVVYRQGTIVLPYGKQCQPLTVYDALDKGGTSKSDFTVGTAYRSLAKWNNAIMSFTLKRGYMVTMANHVDGTGYSHCFIANDADITVNLPREMRGSVSFLRIFPWKWPSKKGLAGHNTTALTNLACTWFYGWNAETYSYSDYDYVPQRHHETGTTSSGTQKWAWPDWGTIDALEENTHVLGQNEPDNTSGAEVYMTVDKLIELHKYFLYSGLRIGTFATCNPNTSWVKDYVDRCKARNMRVDFVATHYYIGGQSPSAFISSLKALHDVSGLPVWVTEWNNGASWTNEGGFTTDSEGWYSWGSDNGTNHRKNGIWLTDCLRRADQCPWLERLCVYNDVGYKRYVYYTDSNWPTPGGELYRNYASDFAYSSDNEYFMPWNYGQPSNLCATTTDEGKVRLTWTNPNTDCSKEVHVQRLEAGTWVDVLDAGISDEESRICEFSDEQATSGVCIYRVCHIDADGTQRYTNATEMIPDSGGFVELTALPSNMADYYFVFQSAEAATPLNLALADGTRQAGYKVAKYAVAVENGSAMNQLWQLESNAAGGYSIRNISFPDYVLCSPNSWNFRTDGTTHYGNEKACYLPEPHYDGTQTYWTLKNVAHNTYCGLWDNDKNFKVGAELAGNRTLAETDHFRLYAITRLAYNQLYIDAGHSDMNHTLANQNFSWGSTTQPPMGSGSISVPKYWTFQKTFDGWNDVFTTTATINGKNATLLNVWAGQFHYAELSQQLNCLPNGVYRITADFATTNGYDETKTWTAVYGAPEDSRHIARSVNITGKGDNTFNGYDVYVLVNNHRLTVGARSDGTWFKVANLQLQYVCQPENATPEIAARLSIGRSLQYIFVNRSSYLQGDVNQDGQLTTDDVTALLRMVLGKEEPTPSADINLDGEVTIGDVVALANILSANE